MSTPTTSPNYSPRHDANADPVGGHCETRRMYRAVLDTCVLVPSLQRDFLLQLAAEEAFAPLWGTGILTELDYVLARLHERRHVMDSDVRRRHLLDQMRRAFPGSEVKAPKDREYHYELSDPEDGHVAHAALRGKADAIVTDDTRAGFTTATVLTEANIEIVSPHEFAVHTISAHPEAGSKRCASCRSATSIRSTPLTRSSICSSSGTPWPTPLTSSGRWRQSKARNRSRLLRPPDTIQRE